MKILALSGLVPEQICDVVRFIGWPGNRNIAHYCGYAADFISQVVEDPTVDGAVFPRTCDSSRILKSYLEGTGKFLYQLTIPTGRDGAAERFLAEELKRFKDAVETKFGVELEDTRCRAQLVARRNLLIKSVYDRLDHVSYCDYHEAILDMLTKPLAEQSFPKLTEKRASGKPVYLVGSTLTDTGLLQKISDCGLDVVGDDLPESGRLADEKPLSDNGDIFMSIAQSMLDRRLSPTQNDFDAQIRGDLDEIAARGARGVIFVTQKFCEPYDFFFYVLSGKLKELGMPTLRISLTDSSNFQRNELALEAFSDML